MKASLVAANTDVASPDAEAVTRPLPILTRLVLKEEMHIRRLRTTERHRETVLLREQEAVFTRTEAGLQEAGDIPAPFGPTRCLPHFQETTL